MDATFWALVALVIFLALLGYLGVPRQDGQVVSMTALTRSGVSWMKPAVCARKPRNCLLNTSASARKPSRRPATSLLPPNARPRRLKKTLKSKTAEFVERRTALAEQKIAQAEAQAIAEVRASAVDIAVAAAGKIIEGKVTGATADKLIKDSIAEVKARLN